MAQPTQADGKNGGTENVTHMNASDDVTLPGGGFIGDAEILRDGQDLVLRGPDGHEVVVDGYFNTDPAPTLMTADGAALTPQLVNAFVQHDGPVQLAANATENDASPSGFVKEVSGHATITHADGTSEPAIVGTPVFQGDIVETDGDGAVNIRFRDDSTFAVSQNARLAIDEYVYDPGSDSGASNFSLLRGVFVYTSGLIGREDPDDVHISTPAGAIGIRGTIIAGKISPDGDSQITVVEGAIVVSNATGETTLSQQFETAHIGGHDSTIQNVGTLDSQTIGTDYTVLRSVNPEFFAGIGGENNGDTATDPVGNDSVTPGETHDAAPSQSYDAAPNPQQPQPEQPPLAPFFAPQNQTFDGHSGDTFEDFLGIKPLTPPPGTSLSGFGDPLAPIAGSAPLPPPPTNATAPLQTAAQTTAVPLPPLELHIVGGVADDNAGAGTLLAVVETTINFPGVSFSVQGIPENSGNPLFETIQVSPNRIELRLTATGATTIADGDLFALDIKATLLDGRTVMKPLGINIVADVTVPGALDLHALTGADGGVIRTGGTGAQTGHAMASLGDRDHDGTADYIFTNGTTSNVYINNSTATVNFVGSPSNQTVANAGDYNSDGYLDYIVGAPGASDYSGTTSSGNAMIISGASGTVLGQLDSLSFPDQAGRAVAGIGDVNGDGFSDVLVGAPGANGGNGATYILFGRSTAGVQDITAFNSATGFALNGTAGSDLGRNASAAGDLDNDGYDDFIVSAAGIGTAYIVFGNNGLSGATLGSVGTASITGINVGTGPDDDIPVMSGDFNGDGISDIALGSTGSDGGVGRIHFFYGHGGAFGNYDLSGDSVTTGGFTLRFTGGGTLEGGGSTGDFNGDGFDDFTVALRTGDMMDVYVIYGRAGLNGTITASNAWLENDANAFHMIYDLNGVGLANPNTDEYHVEFSNAGDQNNDGYDDLLIGTPDYNSGGGQVLLVNGRGNGTVIEGSNVTATANGDHLVGTTGSDVLSNSTANLVSMRAGGGDDILNIDSTSVRTIDGGSGIDTLNLLGNSKNLNFSALGDHAVSNVEVFSMNGITQTIRLNLNDIFHLLQESQDGMLRFREGAGASGTHLEIDGNGTGSTGNMATVYASIGFAAAGPDTTTDPGTTYNTYTRGGYTLLIDQNIDTAAVV